MTNQQILEKAISLAIDGGWDSFGTETHQIDVEVVSYIDGELQPSGVDVDKPGTYICLYRPHATYSVPELIFNHDFAKALWGEARDIESYTHLIEGEVTGQITPEAYAEINDPEANYWEQYLPNYKNEGWQYHLQQMVIAEDPIAYLGENL